MTTDFVKRLREGQVQIGFAMSFPCPGTIELIGRGWDWVWIDSQHGQLEYRDILECVRVCDGQGLGSVVRVPSHEYGAIGRALDMGASGIMAPMVDTADQAAHLVEAAKFPPLGKRSFGGRRVVDGKGRDYAATANTDTLLVAQIETPEAVANAEAIAAQGVDVLFFGAEDFKLRLGIPMTKPAHECEEVAAALKTTAEAARAAGKVSGCVASAPDMLRLALRLGNTLLAGTSDAGLLRTASAAKLTEMRDIAGAS